MTTMDLTPRPDDVYFSAQPWFITLMKVITGIPSALSIIGATVVILTHIAWSKLWPSKGVRHIVVMLSIGDLLLAVSHIWGISQNVEKFLEVYHPNQSDISTTDTQCTTQAVVAVFGTMASFLWTLTLAFFVCSTNCIPGLIDLCSSAACLATYDILCWGFPVLFVIVLGHYYLLGYAESTDVGWCYVSLSSSEGGDHHNSALIFGYEFWTFLFLALILLFSIFYCMVPCVHKDRNSTTSKVQDRADTDTKAPDSTDSHKMGELNVQDSVTIVVTPDGTESHEISRVKKDTGSKVNWRLLMGALLLFILRICNTIVDSALLVDKNNYRSEVVGVFVLFAAVGNSLQGFLNMILFVICTPQFYDKVKTLCQKSPNYENLA